MKKFENEQIQVGARGIAKQPTGEKLITEPQAKRLWAIAKKLNLSDQEIHQVIANYGFSDVAEISMRLYDKVIEELENLSAANF